MKNPNKNRVQSFTCSEEVFEGDIIPSYLGLRKIISIQGTYDDGYVWIDTVPASLLEQIKYKVQEFKENHGLD